MIYLQKLHTAAISGDIEASKFCLKIAADIDYQELDGKTALHFAAQNGHLQVTKYLVEVAGISHLVSTRKGETPYDLAGAKKVGQYKKVMKYLQFHELRLIPEGINVFIENLDEGSGIAQSFIDQKACWHKSGNLKLNRTKLNRAEKQTSHERIDDKATTSKRKLDIAFPFSPPVTRLCAFSVMKMDKNPFMSPKRLDKIHG
ncbi:Hypothetical predicted protein [Mytilus galloprovincialis]|uniref:Uncharacterized protein n=1 Tax=Mytilus galloprovincialis TaxID=29158 RepID=A0A8B6F787_MYTGA|nr:Hypothetical predicted protein [Mytilus galloprovincialis]